MDTNAVALHGPVVAWLQKEFGGAFQEVESFPATPVTPGSVVGNDPNAAALLFVNIGAQDVFLKLRQDLPGTTGIRIGANGGGVSLTIRDDLTLPTREWFAASPGGASQLYILRLSLFSAGQPGTA